MGREVRRVPKDWSHPKNDEGRYMALDQDYDRDEKSWSDECKEWNSGKFPEYACESSRKLTFEEWYGGRPEKRGYMPSWPDSEKTHLMMYETCSEGTPISPVFKTPEELAKWLADNDASAFGSSTASYEAWLRVAKGGFACSAVSTESGIVSGVEGMTQNTNNHKQD